MQAPGGFGSRRQFLKALAVLGAGWSLPGCRPTSAPPPAAGSLVSGGSKLPGGLDPTNFIVHSRKPLALELRRSRFGSGVITPVSRFFVRNNLPMPPASITSHPDHWVLKVEGVARPGSITLAELKGLGLETEAAVVQCSGNGRAFFGHAPSGSPWGVGAAGCALWTGVRVRTVLEHFGGALPGRPLFTATGGEELPDGLDPDQLIVERSVPIEKAMADALLAWEMNGAPMPLVHGGPLRLIVPGYFGVNSIKYVERIAATENESSAKIQRSGYRMRPIDSPGDSTQPSMWRMPVKSWVNGPGAGGAPVLAGSVTFYGVALSGERGIRRVEVSLDAGRTWSEALLDGPDLGPNAWRAFSHTVELEPGSHTIVSRATDHAGDVQPRERQENERGYGHNGWLDAALAVELVAVLPTPEKSEEPAPTSESETAPPAAEITLSDAGRAGEEVFATAQPPCGVCHTLEAAGSQGAVGPNLDALKPAAGEIETAVKGGVGAMPAYGETLSSEQIRDLAAYLVESTR